MIIIMIIGYKNKFITKKQVGRNDNKIFSDNSRGATELGSYRRVQGCVKDT